jgi:homoserine kinase
VQFYLSLSTSHSPCHPQVFNLQRLAVLTTALGQSPPDPELIYEAMKDRVHQPYRTKLIPGLPEVTSRLTLSGAGPTILALATGNFDAIARDATALFAAEGVTVDWQLLEVAPGASIVHHES